MSASPRPGPCLPPARAEATSAAWQAVLVTLLAWAALLCAGLGGTVGGVSQTLAGKLAASAQHLQRHGGTSMSSRALRRELPAATAGLKLAEAAAAVRGGHGEAAGPAHIAARPLTRPQVAPAAPVATPPLLRTRHLAPPGRAPPTLA